MFREVLIVTNNKTFTQDTKDKVKSIVDVIVESGKDVHIFREDLSVYDLVRSMEEVKAIPALSSGADILLFNRRNEGFYNVGDRVKSITPNFGDVYKRAMSRFIVPSRDVAFDEEDYNTRRLSVMNSRMKFAISQIAKTYPCVILIQDSKDFNLVNTITPEYGDGKFIYIYDCVKKRSSFYVGGCILTEENFISCLRGV